MCLQCINDKAAKVITVTVQFDRKNQTCFEGDGWQADRDA